MKGFGGFPNKGRQIKVPGIFFRDLLPQIDSLFEMKVTLYCIWWFSHREDAIYIRMQDFQADKTFMSGLGPQSYEQSQALQNGLEAAVARGTLLAISQSAETDIQKYYLINGARGRAIAEAAELGEWNPGAPNGTALDLRVERPNVFTLYEQNIGALTPLIADRLRDLSDEVGEAWIVEAVELAVKSNVRKLSYIEGIINRWQQEGRVDTQEGSQADDGSRFLSGKYGDEIEY